MRSFEYARKIVDGTTTEEVAYPNAKIPEYATKCSAGADFFCAEEVTIPVSEDGKAYKPTLVHTGIKASMYEDEVLELYNRSSNPKKGLVLANSVGVIDADYYSNKGNDGEIMFSFLNFGSEPVTLKVGDKVGQGVFKKFLKPEINCIVLDTERSGGFGSTDKN